MPSDTPVQGEASSPDNHPNSQPQTPPGPPTELENLSQSIVAGRPRLWTCFALLGVVLVAIIGFQVVGTVVMMIYYAVQGVPMSEIANEIPAKLTQTPWLIFLGILGQAPFLLGAIVAARLSPTESFSRRLKLRPLGWSPTRYALVALSIIPPTAIGMTGAWGLTFIIPPDPTVQQIYDNMTLPFVIPFLLFISLAPGFGEEFFFRGFLQGRFLKRLGPGAAILLSSVIFGLFHVMPHAILFAFVVGLWLGYVAWKTDSIWPTIVCHAFINGIWNVFQISAHMLKFSDNVQYVIIGFALLIGIMAFVASWRILNGDIQQNDESGVPS